MNANNIPPEDAIIIIIMLRHIRAVLFLALYIAFMCRRATLHKAKEAVNLLQRGRRAGVLICFYMLLHMNFLFFGPYPGLQAGS